MSIEFPPNYNRPIATSEPANPPYNWGGLPIYHNYSNMPTEHGINMEGTLEGHGFSHYDIPHQLNEHLLHFPSEMFSNKGHTALTVIHRYPRYPDRDLKSIFTKNLLKPYSSSHIILPDNQIEHFLPYNPYILGNDKKSRYLTPNRRWFRPEDIAHAMTGIMYHHLSDDPYSNLKILQDYHRDSAGNFNPLDQTTNHHKTAETDYLNFLKRMENFDRTDWSENNNLFSNLSRLMEASYRPHIEHRIEQPFGQYFKSDDFTRTNYEKMLRKFIESDFPNWE